MRHLIKIQLLCAAIVALCSVTVASAFNASRYANNSKLATGKWVKISIPENGIYEITYQELRDMGFNNPEKVKVFGFGGHKINEVLNGSVTDDLKKIPILRINNKICFYGCGPVRFSLTDYNNTPHYSREFNPYSQEGCYFLSEDNASDTKPTKRSPTVVSSYVNVNSSLNYYCHEKELVSVSGSGKEMLGEDFANGQLLVDYDMPNIADSTIVVKLCLAANASALCYVNAVLHNDGQQDTTVYPTTTSRIYKGSGVYYNFAAPYVFLKLSSLAEHGQLEPMLVSTASDFSVSLARLDYFILTYKRYNILQEEDNQLFMGYTATNGNERFLLPNASSSTLVWNINTPSSPVEMTLNSYDDSNGSGVYFFAPSTNMVQYIAFDPDKTLKKISRYEDVPNQNLHGLATPDMLIITTAPLKEQAQRIADLHAAIDGIDVAIVDQEQVFNEFSSGTRDGMAYRLLCKMFYDRDSQKFKNLLLLGPGSYDNRELMGKHPNNLLTYQTDNSNYEQYTYTTDDFFAFLEDNSGSNVPGERISVGVGRITSADAEEAESDINKLVEYYANPDYGVWRNNALVFSDAPDHGQYMLQGEGYKNLIRDELGSNMHVTTVHNTMYPRSSNQSSIAVERRTATQAKQMLSNSFKDGMYFATYVGHAGPIAFTKHNSMWTTGDVARTAYPHFPIMSTACCDVARYDSDTRGIAELMFHKRDGGAIALVTSSRNVYANHNDRLNNFFLAGMFSYNANGYMPTLGEAYKACKLGFTTSNDNKMSFFLLGDPAMRVNYPVTLFNITKVAGTELNDTSAMANISPLMEVEVEAQVMTENGEMDNTFNGDVTVTLYDRETEFTTLSITTNGVTTERTIYFNREKLAEVDGRAVNGKYKGTIIVPRTVLAKNETVLLRIYAHKDNSDRMINGQTTQITMLPFDESVAIADNNAPVITSMYINDEVTFTDGAVVSGDAMLYITVTDDFGINMQSNSVDYGMSLHLDGGKPSYSDISCYATSENGGKAIHIEFPLSNLPEGQHTLTYTVVDLLGNMATRTITFMVGQSGTATLMADKLPAFLDGDVNFDLDTDLSRIPEMVVRVTDATGKLVWMTTTDNFPVTWDMKDMNGNKVPAGLYRYFGTYNDGSNYGGTEINRLIVLDPVKTAAK